MKVFRSNYILNSVVCPGSILLLYFLLAGMDVKAQDRVIPLYNKNDLTCIEVAEDSSMSNDGVALLSKVTKPELWFYGQKNKKGPAIIICPGGGYRVEAYEHEGKEVANWLAVLGYKTFVLKYRLPDETLFPNSTFIPLSDALEAIALVRNRSEELGVDENRIGIMGFSAGGHLAASASTLFNSKEWSFKPKKGSRPDFSILIYPVVSMVEGITHEGSKTSLLGINPSPKLVELFSLEKQVKSDTPKALIICASDDKVVSVKNSELYANALRKKNIPTELFILPKGGHGFGYNPNSPAFSWTGIVERWLLKR